MFRDLFYCIKHSFIKDAWASTFFCASYYFYVVQTQQPNQVAFDQI